MLIKWQKVTRMMVSSMENNHEVETIKEVMRKFPVDLEHLFRKLKIRYEKSDDLDSSISGEIERISKGSFIIRTNAGHSDQRQRFTAAHELGHYMLHRLLLGVGVDDNKAYRSDLKLGNFTNSNIKKGHETEANRFAAIVLMPSSLVKDEFNKDQNSSNLARTFCVSEQAMSIRLKSLKLT